MKKKWTGILLVVVLLIMGFLVSCGSDGAGGISGDNVLVYVQMSDPVTLDPHGSNDSVTASAINQMFDRLVDYGEGGEIVPMLAESFEEIDETTWEFVLRQGIEFHDGTPFNAEAVKKSFDRLLDPELASPRAFLFEMLEEVVVIDDYTVHFIVEFPFAPFPAHVAHNAGAIIAPSAILEEENGGLSISENPIGTGPFVYYSWDRGTELVMVRNENYWKQTVYLDGLRFVAIPEIATRDAMLETGEAHVAMLDMATANQVLEVEAIKEDRIASVSVDYIGFNTKFAPFDDVRVRQAISLAIDKEDIIRAVIYGQGIPAITTISPSVQGSPGHIDGLGHDILMARELLEEAGFADGFSATIVSIEGNAIRNLILQLVQANLREIGVDLNIQLVELGAFLEETANGEHDMFIMSWTTVTGDADYGLHPLFHSENAGEAGNRTFYVNEEVDDLLDAARREVNQEVRNELYAQALQIIAMEAPVIPLYHRDFVFGLNGVESGFRQDFSGTPFFYGVRLE